MVRYRNPLYRRRKTRSKAWHEKKDFLKLKKDWYKKLEEDGFEDIELHNWKTGETFERTNGVSQADVVKTYSAEAEEYYRLAAQFVWELEEEGEESEVAIAIWRLHADGVGYRRIAKMLKVARNKVEKTVPRLKKRMLQERVDNWDEDTWATEWLAAQQEEKKDDGDDECED